MAFQWQGVRRRVGDIFTVSPGEAAALVYQRRAIFTSEKPTKRRGRPPKDATEA